MYLAACWRNLVHCLTLGKKCPLTRKDRNFQKQKAWTLHNIYVGLGRGEGVLTHYFLARHAMKRKKAEQFIKITRTGQLTAKVSHAGMKMK
jgi:hypothetical protein